MIRLRVADILEQKGRSRYWLYKQMNMSHQNYTKMINNETQSIKYSNIEIMCQILDCKPGDLFDFKPDEPPTTHSKAATP